LFEENYKTAIISGQEKFTYQDIFRQAVINLRKYREENILPGQITSIESDFSFFSICDFFSLLENRNIVVPLDVSNEKEKKERLKEAGVQTRIEYVNEKESVVHRESEREQNLEIIEAFRKTGDAGLVLFSSGSTGKPKAILKNLSLIVKKYINNKASYRTATIMRFDHQGGVDVLLRILLAGGTFVVSNERTPEGVAQAIQENRVELFPTTPSFLNLMRLSDVFSKYDFSSTRYITYGAEPMPQKLLDSLQKIMPTTTFRQTYGISEIATFTSKPKPGDALYMKISDGDFQYRIVDNELYIRSDGSMVGYINGDSPFTEDGWFPTGDLVEIIEGGFLKIIGRKKEMNNVGGNKVLPREVEEIISEVEGVKEVVVKGEPNYLLGEVCAAYVTLTDSTNDPKLMKQKIKSFCREKLEEYKVPVKISFSSESLITDRFKKNRLRHLEKSALPDNKKRDHKPF